MTNWAVQSLMIMLICGVCTFATRALPFLIFGNRPVPEKVKYLGRVLPMAVMATLVIYCIRGISFTAAGEFLPELISLAAVTALHLWKRNTLLSVVGGTVCYMLLVQAVF